MTDSIIVGAKITSSINGVKIIDFVINHDDKNQTYTSNTEEIEFTGRFGIVRKYQNTEGQDSITELYIGEGSYTEVGNHVLIPESNATSAYTKVENVIVGTQENEIPLGEFNFFPNPAKTLITFNSKVNNLKIYTIQGNLVKQKTNVLKIDISELSAGNYILFINNTHQKELIITK